MKGKNEAAKKPKRGDRAVENKSSPPTSDQNSVNRITNIFLRDIRSLLFTQEEALKVLNASVEKHTNALQTFLNGLPNEKKDNTIKVKIPIEKGGELKRLAYDLSASARSLPLAHRGLFLVLVSNWDAYFGSLLRWVYKVRPEIIDNSSRTISFSELKQINSLDAARNKIVEEEISVVLRESHGEQFDYLERKLSLTLKKLDTWPKFIELTQRRNLIAHADGKVSDQYLKICRDNNVELDAAIKVGVELEIPPAYLRDSCDYLAELGFKLSQVLWRKLQPSEAGKAEDHLLDTTFEMLKAGQYELAIRLLTFSLTPPMKFDEARSRYICVVNLALAYKWTGNEAKCAEIVEAEDWSAVPLELQLAAAVLKNRADEAISLMKQIGTSGAVTKENYDEWPLFMKFRRTKRFIEAYREIFKTGFEVSEVPRDLASALSISSNSGLSGNKKKSVKNSSSDKKS
jgi:hypothetical protein